MRLAALTVFVLAACSSAAAAPSWSWKALHRPLRVPRIDAGSPCPVTARLQDFGRWGMGVGFGPGPAAPLGMNENGRPVLRFLDPIPKASLFYGSEWNGNKVLWAVKPGGAPVLVRGRQLDGGNILRFDRGLVPPRELRIRPGGAPITNRPSFTRVRAPGCYGYQVDGLTFSYVIVFEAIPVG